MKKSLLGVDKIPAMKMEEEKTKMDEKALSLLQLNLSNEVLREVSQETTIAGLWLKLKKFYKKKTLASRLHLKQRLYLLRMSEGTSVKSHIDWFSSINMDLSNINVKIDDEDQALLLSCSLPSSYKNFRETILYGHESITMDVVKVDLFSKELMGREFPSTSESKGESLTTRGRTSKHDSNGKKRNKFRSKSRKKNKYHNYCKKKGHIKDECYKL